MNFIGIGFPKLVFILMVALLVLGPNKAVDVARTLGKYMRELQRMTSEIPRLFSLEEEQSRPYPPQGRELPEQPANEERHTTTSV